MTVGPWKPICLHAYTARISDFHVKSTVSPSLDTISVDLSLSLVPSTPSDDSKATVTIKKPDGSVLGTHDVPISSSTGTLKLEYKKGDVDLWWPVGYGAQPMYTFNVEVSEAHKPVASKSQRIGFRRVKVVQEPLEGQEGLSFLFEVNGVRIFAGGSNWYVPVADQ